MKKNRILIAEESSQFRADIKEYLSAEGLGPFKEVMTVEEVWRSIGIETQSGKLFILNDYTIELIVLDLNFAGIGAEICHKIKQHDMDLPVLCVSDSAEEDDELLAIESGADAFEHLPLNIKKFRVKARKLIERWEAHSRLRANYESLKTVYKTLPPVHRSTHDKIGDYKVIGALGKGASSVVYKCRREDSLYFFAVKILNDDMAQSPETIVAFRDEIDNIRGLDHPNIIKVVDHGIQSGFPYYVMDYVSGCNLGKLDSEEREFTFDEILAITTSLIDCLDYIHENHVIHGDVKMENILITEKWEVKLTDFGLSIQEEKKKTTIQGVMGTPLYLAPELIAGREETYKVDTYAFGIVLYKLLTSKFPFDSTNVAEIMHGHCTQEPERVDKTRPEIPKVWADLVEACLEKNPNLRPDSLMAFTDKGETLASTAFNLN
ncbi:MAG: protein kinase [Lentisphaerales bacterium]|nr:protein kinase [Lentisphaerales bacterium]